MSGRFMKQTRSLFRQQSIRANSDRSQFSEECSLLTTDGHYIISARTLKRGDSIRVLVFRRRDIGRYLYLISHRHLNKSFLKRIANILVHASVLEQSYSDVQKSLPEGRLYLLYQQCWYFKLRIIIAPESFFVHSVPRRLFYHGGTEGTEIHGVFHLKLLCVPPCIVSTPKAFCQSF